LNSYTGEDGSDGVVRIAAANLNARHAVLSPRATGISGIDTLSLNLSRGPRCAFKLMPDAAHCGADHGIVSSAETATVQTVLRCLQVRNFNQYVALCTAFETENANRDAYKVELEPAGPFAPRVHIHDPCSLLIVRLADDTGEPLRGAGFLLTAGSTASVDLMPEGFMLDRQAHSKQPATISLFLNYSLLAGSGRVADPRNERKTLRPAVASHRPYGAIIHPVDLSGLVHHALAASAGSDDLFTVLGPHQTTVLDVVLPRKVHQGVFRLTRSLTPDDFRKPMPGPLIP
ncbi:MAG: phospholipase, partial [Pseudomonadota bacterium]|nr:phospholipase [Pseudomonadota bacterium]